MASNSIIASLYPLSSSILNTKSFFQSHCFSSPKSRNSSLSLYGDEVTRRTYSQTFITPRTSPLVEKTSLVSTISRCSGSSNVSGGKDEPPNQNKTPFGYTRKDVILIGVGLTVVGVGLKSGLEYVGVDPLQAGNVVQLVLVLGLTVGWISTYIFRVSNKEMTYAQQLRDYEDKVMQKRLESLTEAEMQALLEQVEEEKTRLASGEK